MGDQSTERRGTPLGERLAWPAFRSIDRPKAEDRDVMVRTYVYMFGAGALLLALTVALPGAADRETGPIVAVAAGCLALAGGLVVWFDQVSLRALEALPALATVLIGVVVWAGGASLVAAYAMFFFWIVLVSCYLFSVRLALLHSAFAIAVCVTVVALLGGVSLPEQRGLLAAGTLVVAAGMMLALRARIAALIAELDRAAATDPLTGLLNRRRFEERFTVELERIRRTGRPVALVALDIDQFKRVNDTDGHDAGDRVLRELAVVLEDQTRAVDAVARLGGDEFAVLAPETGPEGAVTLAERLRARVAEHFAGRSPNLTVSCGVAVGPADGATPIQLSRAADRALYRAKSLGRDLVALAGTGGLSDEAAGADPAGAEISLARPAAR